MHNETRDNDSIAVYLLRRDYDKAIKAWKAIHYF